MNQGSNGPSKRRRLWQVVAGLSILVAAFAVFAWQQGDDGDGPLNAIAAAAEKTQEEPGGHATIRSVITSPVPSESMTMTGQMVYDDEAGRTRAVMEFPNPESGELVTMKMVSDETVIYMRSSTFGPLPDGAQWMALDLSFGEDLDMSLPSDGDAEGELELLEQALGVRKLGRERVRGVPTTRYGGTVSVAEQAARLREEGGEDLAPLLEENGTPLRLEVWIDAEGLVRRIKMVKTQPREDGEGSVTTNMRMDFFDFGSVPEIDIPDSSEVFDATSLAEGELGLSDD